MRSFILILLAAGSLLAADEPQARWRMRHADVVFMYAPKTPELYGTYGCNVLLWGPKVDGGGAAKTYGVHRQGNIWFLTAWGKNLAQDPQLLQSVCVDIEGKPIEVPWLTDHKQKLPNYWGCTNAPYYRAYLKKQALDAISAEAAGLHIDDHCGTAACASFAGGCFCEHCMAGFRTYLKKSLTQEQLAALGVRDVDSFDFAAHVRQSAKTKQEYQKRRWEMPLFIHFITFQARAESALVGEIRAACEAAAKRPLSFSANCCLPNVLHLADYMHLDTVCGEVDHHASAGKPSESSHLAYKVADSIERPLASTASGWDWAWINEKNKPGLVKLWVAESYAMGNCLMAPHHQWCYTSQKGTHWWDGKTEDFAPTYKYIATNRNLFDGFEGVSDVVVVFNSQAAFRGRGKYGEIAAYLARNNIQYRLAMAGGTWIDRRVNAKELLAASRVIVSTAEFLDAPQLEAIEAARKAGKVIDWTGPASCEGRLPRSVQVEGRGNVWALVRRNAKTGEVALHLLNRDYALDQDGVWPAGKLTVSIANSLIGGKFTTATLRDVPAGKPRAVPLRVEGDRTIIEAPGLGTWSIIVLHP